MFQVQDTQERWKKKYHVTPKQVVGHFAMWALRQTPYFPNPPENLQQVLVKLNELFTARCEHVVEGKFHLLQVSMRELDTLLRALVEHIPEVLAWNERKNKREGMAFVTRYESPEPDDDFIDLDALTRNTAMSIMLEEERAEHLDGATTPRSAADPSETPNESTEHPSPPAEEVVPPLPGPLTPEEQLA